MTIFCVCRYDVTDSVSFRSVLLRWLPAYYRMQVQPELDVNQFKPHAEALNAAIEGGCSSDELDQLLQTIAPLVSQPVCNDDGWPVVMTLIGNKCDLEDQRQVTRAQGEMLAVVLTRLCSIEVSFIETSAKTGYNVDEVFNEAFGRAVDLWGVGKPVFEKTTKRLDGYCD